jgi:hypothetical protein
MAVAANRIPGASLASLPGIDSLRSAPRGTQVDAVVSLLLAGAVSPDTRAVLMKGENPLAATATAPEGQNPQMATTLRANAQARGLGSVPQLSGVAQIIGLALGSPEFQRR